MRPFVELREGTVNGIGSTTKLHMVLPIANALYGPELA